RRRPRRGSGCRGARGRRDRGREPDHGGAPADRGRGGGVASPGPTYAAVPEARRDLIQPGTTRALRRAGRWARTPRDGRGGAAGRGRQGGQRRRRPVRRAGRGFHASIRRGSPDTTSDPRGRAAVPGGRRREITGTAGIAGPSPARDGGLGALAPAAA